jgi:hypothetical protein
MTGLVRRSVCFLVLILLARTVPSQIATASLENGTNRVSKASQVSPWIDGIRLLGFSSYTNGGGRFWMEYRAPVIPYFRKRKDALSDEISNMSHGAGVVGVFQIERQPGENLENARNRLLASVTNIEASFSATNLQVYSTRDNETNVTVLMDKTFYHKDVILINESYSKMKRFHDEAVRELAVASSACDKITKAIKARYGLVNDYFIEMSLLQKAAPQ